MVRFPSYCFLCNNEKGEQSRGMNPCPGILLRWSLEDRWGKCLRGLKYQFKTSFSAHHRKTTFRPWRRSQGQKRTQATIYWSCLKNAVDKAGVGRYSCVLLKSQRCTAVHLLGKRYLLVGAPEQPHMTCLVKLTGFPNLCVAWSGRWPWWAGMNASRQPGQGKSGLLLWRWKQAALAVCSAVEAAVPLTLAKHMRWVPATFSCTRVCYVSSSGGAIICLDIALGTRSVTLHVKLPQFQTWASALSADASKTLWEEWVPLSFHWMESNTSFQLQA